MTSRLWQSITIARCARPFCPQGIRVTSMAHRSILRLAQLTQPRTRGRGSRRADGPTTASASTPDTPPPCSQAVWSAHAGAPSDADTRTWDNDIDYQGDSPLGRPAFDRLGRFCCYCHILVLCGPCRSGGLNCKGSRRFTANLDVPINFLIRRCCLIRVKNSSNCQFTS